MFDTYVSRNITERVTESVTAHAHRAPTDESVKLLNELTEKALKNIDLKQYIADKLGCVCRPTPTQENCFV